MCAKGLKHTRSTIVCCASTYTNDKLHATLIQRGSNQLTYSIGCCEAWIALLWRDQWQARAGGHFNHGGFPISHQTKKGLNRLPQRTCYFALDQFSTSSVRQRFYSAVAAIGHWYQADLYFGMDLMYTLRDSLTRFKCA